ncbi:PREDICTED: peroxisomal membrane protein PEX13-like [Dufourea novaeangliae]|uniref:Peroxisomal membrane protein PEX13 n=1 Tax=Dufourea novaeangliae TaxID=178035 RepID=A0A154P4J0_DUFNO|nr:PREDICTED: peroxisomal membrane protein PEX13-like [Dufourea novaeangliae]KZC06234.1 Peroxisomal membrane protein PEX13 [Dufourea novaeangliae]
MAPERSNSVPVNQLRNVPQSITSSPSTSAPFPSTNIQSGIPPPIPPRQPVQSYSGFNDYRPFGSNSYGGFGYGLGNQYRGLNGYGGYSSYGYAPYSTYNNYGTFGGHSGDVENRFFQYVEESTRPTFQLIETVLQTFSSMTMLLESTYFTLTNSFKAILTVAENVGKLRSTVGQLFSTFALIRFLKWLYRKIMRTAGFPHERTTNEELWEKSLAKIGNENINNSSFWSGFLLFSVFFVVPYMIHKITDNIRNAQVKGKDPKDWYQYDQPVFVATVLYDFNASNNEELSVGAGQKLYLAPQALQPKHLPGWCKATDNVNVGFIPYNYIKVIGQLRKRKENEINSLAQEKPSTMENHWKNTKENDGSLKMTENVTHDV